MNQNNNIPSRLSWSSLLQKPGLIPLLAALLSAALFAITLQTHINGSYDYYATDVGEIQNALPRWGTLHFTGYPQYSITGSLLVSLLRVVGVPPAAGASLVSLLWGVVTIALTAQLCLELGAKPLPALVGASFLAVSTSFWIDSSIAEIHTMTMAFTIAIIWLSIRFGRTNRRTDLLWLAFVASQGLVHMRSILFIAPASLILVAHRWRTIKDNILPVLGIGLAAPLIYLYMPLREWMGAGWTFGNTSTWQGFWTMVLDTKAERIVSMPASMAEWIERANTITALLADDLPLITLVLGLVGLILISSPEKRFYRYEVIGSHLAWLAYFGISLIIWEGRVSDALLAVKLPVSMMAGIGLALLVTRLDRLHAAAGYAGLGLLMVGLIWAGWTNYPDVRAITKDRSIETTIATAEQAADPDRPLVLMALWGHSYWGIKYAQDYRGQLENLTVVDHNASAEEIVAEGYGLVTLSETFYVRPVDWWADLLGPVYPDSYAPGLVEIRTTPREADKEADLFPINDDLAVESITVDYRPGGDIVLTVYWRAINTPQRHYSIAAHLWATTGLPGNQENVLAQADSVHPVDGWYPTTHWTAGQVVRDTYRLPVSPGAQPKTIAVTAYYVDEAGEFVSGDWLTLPFEGDSVP